MAFSCTVEIEKFDWKQVTNKVRGILKAKQTKLEKSESDSDLSHRVEFKTAVKGTKSELFP